MSRADEPQELVEELLAALEARKAPEGMWLVQIEEARAALADVDALLRRLRDAIIRQARDSGPGSPLGP